MSSNNKIRKENIDSFIGVKFPLTNSGYGYFNPSILTIEQVKTNIKNLILTNKNERVFENVSCNLKSYLFEPIDEFETSETIKSVIKKNIKKYFPGVYMQNLQVKTDKDKAAIYVYMEISIDREIYEELVFKILGEGN